MLYLNCLLFFLSFFFLVSFLKQIGPAFPFDILTGLYPNSFFQLSQLSNGKYDHKSSKRNPVVGTTKVVTEKTDREMAKR